MEVVTRSLSAIVPYAQNPRRNSSAVDAVAESIRRFGFRQPIVVDAAGVIICGHTRYLAAQKLGLTEAPVHVATDLSSAQVRAYRIADNKTAELADWDEDRLSAELVDLAGEDIDWSLLGFGEGELRDLLGDTEGLTDPDDLPDLPDPPASPVTRPGALWILGDHRLLCGDSTKREDVERVMNGERACCVFTDPPYGVSIAAKNEFLNANCSPNGGNTSGGRNTTQVTNDNLSPQELKELLLRAFQLVHQIVMSDECTVFVCAPQGGGLGMMMMMMMLQEACLEVRHVLIWKKDQPTFSMGRLDYEYQHEPILLTWGKRHKSPMQGAHRTSVWEIDRPRKSADHPTMKPVELVVNALMNNSDPEDVVYDAFSGSGTTIIAAEQLNRRCRAIEISPQYVDVAVKRWEKYTGKQAILAD